MKKILCFGDSNTFGFNPENGQRYDKNTRWTGILQELGKDKFKITEAGCNNRTCFIDNPDGINYTGYKILPEILNENFDIIIIALGINDLQKFYNPSMKEIQKGIENLTEIAIKKQPNAKIIIASPARLSNNILNGIFSFQFDKNSIQKSLLMPDIYKSAAEKNNCLFFDLDKITKVSPIDGLHFSKESHKQIACALYDFLLECGF